MEHQGSDDAARVDALGKLGILDTPPEPRFDRLTRLASAALRAPIALVTLVDSERQWFKSRVGVDVAETPRAHAFCSHAIMSSALMEVADARLDPRFRDNPLVTGAPFIRFYAGQPLHAPDGHAVGTLCVIDRVPRTLSEGERALLRDLAALAEDEIQKNVLLRARDDAERKLRVLHAEQNLRIDERTRSLRDANAALRLEIAQRQALERILRGNEARMRTILDASFSAFISIDGAGRIVDWNPSAARTFGWSLAEVQGRDLSATIIPERLRAAHRAGLARMLAGGAATVLNKRLELPAVTRAGAEITVEMTISAYAENDTVCFGAFLHDITERETARAALAQQQALLEQGQQRLRAVTENLPALIGHVDKAGNFTFVNSRAARFYGKPRAQLIGQSVASVYDAEGYARIAPHIALALQGHRASFEHYADINGTLVHYQANYIPDVADDGSIQGLFAMAFDITARKESELRQRDSEERLRLITDNLPVLISYVDRERRVRFANAVHRDWLGVDPARMIGMTMREVLGDAFSDRPESAMDLCLQGRTVEGDMRLEAGGVPRTVHSLLIPHLRGDEVLGAYILTTDVTAARAHEQQLEALAMTDALTGLANRRSYDDQLARAIDRAARSGEGLALMYLDVDHFKAINDTLGHALGDEVLKEFARRLLAAVRKTDLVCRLAGDEFTIILESVASAAECGLVGEKIVAAMAAPFNPGTRHWQVGASIGIAWSPAGTATVDSLSQRADRALYQAKAAGRNQYALASPD